MNPTSSHTPLMQATPTHLVVSPRAVMGALSVLALVGLTVGCIGLREAYLRLPASGDIVLTTAIVVAATAVAITLFVGLVVIPRHVQRTVLPPTS